MASSVSKKMPRAERRAQLLETAHNMVREQGTDALTLGGLAERAGVSKPIAYSHFETRAGLMIALYKEINDRQVRALDAALRETQVRLGDFARLIAQAYMECHDAVGPEWHAIAAALKGDAQMSAYQQEMIDGHIALFIKALAPLVTLSETEISRRCIAIIGAAEALSDAMVNARISKDEAVDELASLISTWLAAN
ncbi:TetR/AcrR family transcriptional regulator [Breoghania sp.]|uniref:TetR/AcrR family transcriptional regulator n=1 Tax=Breoghania sp. TaxID=2065378 RepID=UPI002AAB440F|nr:TetR/AcrR family transcriptional regulator [Breoghania sp.]